jgi:hypothetical protein
MKEDAQPANDLLDDIVELDRDLLSLRGRADDREAQHLATFLIEHLAGLPLPSGHGGDVDAAFLSPKAAAILLMKSLRRARKNVPTLPQDIDDLIRCIDRLRGHLPAVISQVMWAAAQKPNERD